MGSRLHSRIVVLAVLITVNLIATFPRPTGAQSEDLPAVASPAKLFESAIVRLYVRDRDHLNAVAGELDIWEAHPEDGYVLAFVTPDQHEWLEGLGYRIEVDDAGTAAATRAYLDPRYHYFDDFRVNADGRYMVDFLKDVNTAYPELTELYDIGDAWLAGQPGEHDRDIWVLRVTQEDPTYGPIEDKPVLFLFATMHAREVATAELAIRYIKYLTEGYRGDGGYGVDPDVTWLVNHHAVHVLVMQNPDGHWKNEANPLQYRRKNMDADDGCDNLSYLGVDLNRNHSFLWSCCAGSSSEPCKETYRGPSRASEPETQAFESYFATVMLDQNGPNGDDEIPPAAPDDTTGIFISLHSYADMVLWPWGFQGYGDSPNQAQLQTIGRKFAHYTGYDPSGNLWYDVDGATDDWTYGKFGVASFTFEVGPSIGNVCGNFFPPYGCIDGIDGMDRNFWAETKPAFVYAHKIAHTPYMTTYGPDTQDIHVMPDVVPQGTAVDLTAVIADHRYGSDPLAPIAAAECFVDAPGLDGTGFPMSPTDGDWGGFGEEVISSIDTAGLDLGRHYILVHGRNDEGRWGPFSAVFVDMVCAAGDINCDGYVDLNDYAAFETCLAGPGQHTPPSACSEDQFHRADFDHDMDVDVRDFAALLFTLGT